MSLMGFPKHMFDDFLEWEWNILHSGSLEKMQWALRNVLAFLREFIAEKEKNPDEHLTSSIVHGTTKGRPFTEDEKIGMVWFLWLGGLDTVAATISQMFRRMALQPEIQTMLRNDPELINGAVEEFLRTQPILNTGRRAHKDFEWHGVQIKAGDSFSAMNVAGNFDPTRFENPRKFDPTRKGNRHFTLIGGVHSCLGGHLARRELRMLLETWFRLIPGVPGEAGRRFDSVPGAAVDQEPPPGLGCEIAPDPASRPPGTTRLPFRPRTGSSLPPRAAAQSTMRMSIWRRAKRGIAMKQIWAVDNREVNLRRCNPLIEQPSIKEDTSTGSQVFT